MDPEKKSQANEQNVEQPKGEGNVDTSQETQFDARAPIPIKINKEVKRSDTLGGIKSNWRDKIESDQKQTEEKPEEGDPEKVNQPTEENPQPDPEGQPVEAEDDLEKPLEFKEKVSSKLDELNLSEEDQEKFIGDLGNWAKYTKANTDRAMELSQREKELVDLELVQAFAEVFSTNDFIELAKTIQSNQDILEVTDDLFEESKENPLRKLLSMFDSTAPQAQKLTKTQIKQRERDAEIDLKEQIVELQSLQDSPFDYQTLDERVATGEIADKFGLDSLILAHYIRVGMGINEIVNKQQAESKKKIDALQKEIKELKEKVPKEPQQTKKEEKQLKQSVVTSNPNSTNLGDVLHNVRKGLLQKLN